MPLIRFDVETDGLLPELTKVHCFVTNDGGPEFLRFHDDPHLPREGTIADGLALLAEADAIIAHNGIGFDVPALQQVYPGWAPRGRVYDSAIIAAAVWPDEHRKASDHASRRPIPGNLVGRNSLESWGHRLGEHKAGFSKDFSRLTLDMLTYCAQDVVVLDRLVKRIEKTGIPPLAVELEQAFAAQVRRQIDRGFRLDLRKVDAVVARLAERRAELDAALADEFGTFTDVYYTPKKQLRREKVTPFNPNSRHHIARAFRERHGWRPKAFTDTGAPKVDEAVLATLDYPGAALLSERLMVQKRLGQLAEGDNAWLKLVQEDGRVRGFMAHNGAVTCRCTHRKPNMGQVPAVGKPWGRELRECWVPEPGWKLVVVDASGLEARILGHYAAAYDGGELAALLLEGDVHTRNMEAFRTDSRHRSKTAFYAIMFGAGSGKVGRILGVSAAEGGARRDAMLKALPGLGRVVAACKADAKSRGWVPALDGRKLWVRHEHAALNTLIQGGGAIVMKQAVADWRGLLDDTVPAHQVAYVHDEIVVEAPDVAGVPELVGAAVRRAIVGAGEKFDLRVPLDAKVEIGDSWAVKA